MANQIRFNVGFQVDRSGLNELQSALAQVQIAASKATGMDDMSKKLREAGKAASQLSDILNQSWNNKLGQLDLSKVNNGIKEAYGNVSNLKATMISSGPAGAAAYNQVASAILNTNLQLKQSNKLLDEMATSMANTVKWGITSSIFNNISSSIQQAYGYTKKLDSSLNDIRIVTEKSAESMEKFARQANNAAKGLGASTLDYTDASLIYYQQGLNDDEVAARAETTLKAANVTGQTGEEVSEQLTAVWNGYKVTAQEAELYVDKLAAVAATTASDLEELSTGMSKVASAANAMGVDVDQLNAQLATIVSVTRQAPESVGTALKTIYARMSDLKLGETDEDGLGLGDVSGAMEKMGISIMDETGNLRDMGTVIEEVAAKWDTWSEAQKTAMAQVMAGKRQYNNLVALFENWDMYTDSLETSANAAGTLQKQQDIYMESTEAHLQQLRTEAERTYDILFNQDTVNGFSDVLSGTLNIFNDFIEGIGGGGKAIIYFGSLVSNVFNQQIAKAIQTQRQNFEAYKNNLVGKDLKTKIVETFSGEAYIPKEEDIQRKIKTSHAAAGSVVSTKAVMEEAKIAKEILKVEKALTVEQHKQLISIQKKVGQNAQELEDIQSYKKIFKEILKDENASFEIAQINLDKMKEELKEQQQTLKQINDLYIKRYQDDNFVDNADQSLQDTLYLEQAIANIEASKLLTEQQKNQLKTLTLDKNGKIRLSEENIKTIMELQQLLLIQQNAKYKELNMAVDNLVLDESGRTQELNEQNEALIRQVKQETELAQQQIKTGKNIQIATAAVGTLTAAIGGLGTILDNTSSKVEKTNAWGSIISGAATAIGSAFGPVGMVIGGIISAITTAVTSAISKSQQELEEAMEENKRQWESLRSDIQKTNSDIKTLQSLSGEFNRLSLGVSQYGENISLTADEYERYQEIIEQIVGISDDVVLGYTREGEAIVNNNNLIEETIKLLQQQQLEQKKLLLSDENMETTYKAAEEDYEKAKKVKNTKEEEYKDRKWEIEMANTGNTGLDYLNNLSFSQIYTKIDKSQQEQYKTDTNNIRNLFLDEDGISVDVDKLIKNKEEIYKKIQELQEKYNISDTELWAQSGYEGTDEFFESLNKQIEKMNNSTDKIEEAEKELEQKTKALNDKVITWLEVEDSNYQNLGQNQQLIVQKYIDSFSVTEFNDETFDELKKKAAAFSEVIKEVDEETQIELEKLINPNNFTTYQEYLNAVVSFFKKESQKTDGLTQEEIMNLLGLSSLSATGMSDEITEKAREIEKLIGDKFGKDFNILKYFSGEDILNADGLNIGGLNLETISNLQEFEAIFDSVIVKSRELNTISQNFNLIQENISAVTAGLKEFQETGIISIETILDLERRYPELAKIQDKTSHEYLQRLREIRDQEEDNARASLEEKRKVLQEKADYYNSLDYENMEEVEVNANVEEFEQTMQDLLSTEYELAVQIKADMVTDVEDGFGIADELDKLKDLVPEDLTISFDRAQELIKNGYAEILQNAKETSESSIKLDKAVVDAFIDNRQAEIEADKQEKIQQLQNQRAVLVTQKEILQRKLTALEEAAKAETATDAATAILKAANADKEYKTSIEALNKTVDGEAETATETERINSTLFNDLAGMYVTNSLNQQESEKAITENQKENVSNRISNLKQLYDSYKAVGDARLYSEGDGEAPGEFPGGGDLKGGVSAKAPTTSGTTGNTITAAHTTPEDIANYAKELFSSNKAEYDNTISASINATKAELEGVDEDIGSIDAAIAAMNSSGLSLDNAQDKAGKEDGSGSSQEERNAEYKNADEEIDRYWELNKAIEQVTEALSDLDKKQEKLYGRELINSLKQENELLAQQAQAYENLAAEQQKEAAELRGTLSAYGVVFDAQGGVTNYLAASQAALEQYNAAVAAYNAFLIDEATFQAAERAYENFKAQLDRYETLYYDEMVDTQNQLDDIRTKTLENNLKVWETELQIRLDLHEAERDWNDFLNEINEDFKSVFKDLSQDLNTMLKNATEYADLSGNMIVEEGQNSIPFAGTLGIDMAAMQDVMGEIDKLKNGGTSDMFSSMSEAQEKLKELINQTMEDTKALQDLYQEAWETYMEGIDQSAEKFEDLMDKFSLIDDELAYQGELIELLYGEEAYGLMNELYDAQAKNGLEQIKSLQQQKDMWYELWQNAEEGSEEQKKYYELWTQAQGDLNNKVTEYIKLLKDDYANTIDGILKDLETKLSGGSSFDDIADEWDNITDRADNYLDNIEKMYEIQSLANKINSDIDDGSISLKNQQKLQEFRDKEIAALREKEKLTQYDLDAADARYEIMLKEIALEDAQNAKNSMKLTRGTDGNWSYQYIADEEQSANAQQELLDTYNNYYQLADEAYAKNLQRMQELQQAYVESIREIMADETLSAAEKEAKIAEIRQRFEEDYSLLVKDNTKIRDDLAIASSGLLLELFNTDKENYKQMTDNQKTLVDGLISNNITDFLELENAVTTNFDGIGDKANTVMAETSEAWDSGAQGMIQNTENIQEAINSAYDAIIEANDEYQKAVNEAAAVIGEDWGEDGIAGAIGEAEAATDSLSEATEDLVEETKSSLTTYKAAVEAIEEIWYAVKSAILEALEAAREYANLEPPEAPTYTPPTVPTTPGGGGNGTYGGGPGGGGNGDDSNGPGSSSTKSYTVYHRSGNGDEAVYYISPTPSGVTASGSYSTVKASANILRRQGHSVSSGVAGKTFKTGGYTGSWTDGNPEVDNGKLAWLHQKELVLNAKDTENILDAVQTIRNLSNLSSSIEDMIMRNLSSMIIKMANIGTNVNYSTENSEQSNNNTFNITAEFPNANDVTSIREAILSLPNIASQYIHENRK